MEKASPLLLEVRNIKKNFLAPTGETISVLKGISFSVEQGERIAIVGKSGSGKSTFLHILGTLESPSSGSILFEQEELSSLPERKLSHFRNQNLGFVFQFHYLMLEFTALENVLFPALIAGKTFSAARKDACSLLDRVGLQNRITHKPAQLSGGEQQRVAIARALMMRPKLLLTDEMTGNLDPMTSEQILGLIEEIREEFQITMISVTHDDRLASSYQRVFRLQNGNLMQQ